MRHPYRRPMMRPERKDELDEIEVTMEDVIVDQKTVNWDQDLIGHHEPDPPFSLLDGQIAPS